MTSGRWHDAHHHRTGSTLLAVCYAFGLLATIGHLACAHAACVPSCHDEQDHACATAVGQHAVIVGDHHDACDHDHQDDHVGVAIADQKSVDAGASHVSVAVRTFALPNQARQYRQPLDRVFGVRRGAVATAASRAPPAYRMF